VRDARLLLYRNVVIHLDLIRLFKVDSVVVALSTAASIFLTLGAGWYLRRRCRAMVRRRLAFLGPQEGGLEAARSTVATIPNPVFEGAAEEEAAAPTEIRQRPSRLAVDAGTLGRWMTGAGRRPSVSAEVPLVEGAGAVGGTRDEGLEETIV